MTPHTLKQPQTKQLHPLLREEMTWNLLTVAVRQEVGLNRRPCRSFPFLNFFLGHSSSIDITFICRIKVTIGLTHSMGGSPIRKTSMVTSFNKLF